MRCSLYSLQKEMDRKDIITALKAFSGHIDPRSAAFLKLCLWLDTCQKRDSEQLFCIDGRRIEGRSCSVCSPSFFKTLIAPYFSSSRSRLSSTIHRWKLCVCCGVKRQYDKEHCTVLHLKPTVYAIGDTQSTSFWKKEQLTT